MTAMVFPASFFGYFGKNRSIKNAGESGKSTDFLAQIDRDFSFFREYRRETEKETRRQRKRQPSFDTWREGFVVY